MQKKKFLFLFSSYAQTLLPFTSSFCTCHVDRLGEDVFLRAARPVVFLGEVGETGCVGQRGGSQQHVDAGAEHALKILRDQPAHSLGLHKVVLVVPVRKRPGGDADASFSVLLYSPTHLLKDNLAK